MHETCGGGKKKRKKKKKRKNKNAKQEMDTSMWGENCCMGCTSKCNCTGNEWSGAEDDDETSSGYASSASDDSNNWNNSYGVLPQHVQDALDEALHKHYNAGLDHAHLLYAPLHFCASKGFGKYGKASNDERAALLGEGARIRAWKSEGGDDEDRRENEDEEGEQRWCGSSWATVTHC